MSHRAGDTPALSRDCPFQNGVDQLHLHMLSDDPFPILQEPASSTVAEGGGNRLARAHRCPERGAEAVADALFGIVLGVVVTFRIAGSLAS